uniref:Rap guanine nucleotide exchange factor (GEF) 3 n=1 Tax=Oryzias latipes TaxID=8090 RepID=A0A3P9M2M3_ORYLA
SCGKVLHKRFLTHSHLLATHTRYITFQHLQKSPLTKTEIFLFLSVASVKFLSDRVVKAARSVYSVMNEKNPGLIRDRKHHLKTHRQCCSGKELVDWLMKQNECLQSRSQAVGMWQVLVDEGILVHVKHELNFQDKEAQFYRFQDSDFGLSHIPNEKESEEELQEALALLSQLGPDALLTMILRKTPSQRTAEDIEVIYEELLHVKAAAHLSTSVTFPFGFCCDAVFSQGDKGTSWYIIWKGSVNVITHGKGIVTTLHEGEDFGQLALLNDAPRAATIILREDNCHFLRVDKQDFIRILKDVEANTVRLEEHGKTVLVLEQSTQSAGYNSSLPFFCVSCRYTVMSGTPEKILEHLLETIKLDSNGYDPIDPCVIDFLLTHKVFMPTSQLCPALQHQYPQMLDQGSEQEKDAYIIDTKQKVVKLISHWVAVYGFLLKEDPVAMDFLEKEVAADSRLSGMLKEQYRERRRTKIQHFDWFSNCDEALGRIQPIKAKDKNRAELKLEASAVYTALGLNERLFICTSSEVEHLRPLKEQQGPEQGTTDILEQIGSKDMAAELTNFDWELFTAVHEVELVYYIFGRNKFPGAITANLERFVRHFNKLQYWVVTELCLCEDLMKRALLLKKFIKIASRIPSKIKRIYCTYERLMDPSRNHRAYRLAVAKLNPPYIPFMPLLLKDMTFIHEGNPSYVDKLVNFEKMVWLKVFIGFRIYLSSFCSGVLCQIHSRVISSSHSDSDHSLPQRSPTNIRLYIQNLKVIDNQRQLTQRSRALEC